MRDFRDYIENVWKHNLNNKTIIIKPIVNIYYKNVF